MTVSKAFWKIVVKNIGTIITYTAILLLFGSMNMSSNTSTQYEAVEPSIAVFNHDKEIGITKSFVEYLDKNADIKTGYEDDDRLKDALFYEDVSIVVDIPEGFNSDMLLHRKPEVKLRSTSGYTAELGKIMIRRYLTVAENYAGLGLNESQMVEKIEAAINEKTDVEVASTVDISKYSRATRYFSYANYPILACVITIICLIMTSFKRLEIRKRNLVSSMELTKMNATLLRNCCIYSFFVWLFYFVIGIIILGTDVMLCNYGALYAVNSLVFCACATTIAYLISNIVFSKGAVNGVMNVVALGSSFLCGAFVPMEYMPDTVLAIAHALPSYYFIDANNKIMELEAFDFEHLLPIIFNICVVVLFSVGFVIIANIISKKRQKVA